MHIGAKRDSAVNYGICTKVSVLWWLHPDRHCVGGVTGSINHYCSSFYFETKLKHSDHTSLRDHLRMNCNYNCRIEMINLVNPLLGLVLCSLISACCADCSCFVSVLSWHLMSPLTINVQAAIRENHSRGFFTSFFPFWPHNANSHCLIV